MSNLKKSMNPISYYPDRTEILKTDFRLQDRVEGIVGMTVEEVHVGCDYFTLLCRDRKNGKDMRVHVAKSRFGDRGNIIRLSATEIIYNLEK